MYPKLRPDVYVEPAPDGMRLAVDGKAYLYRGQATLRLFERLAPYLDGKHSLEQLTRPLRPEQQQVVRELLHSLQGVAAVRDHSDVQGLALPDWLTRHYGPSLNYLETLGDGAVRRFLALRRKRVWVLGGGSAVRVLAPALWKAGVCHGRLQLPPGDPFAQAHRESLARQAELDPELGWEITPDLPFSPDPPPDLVVAVGTVAQVRAQWEAFLRQRWPHTAFVPVVLSSAWAALGPLFPGGTCLDCVLGRLEPADPPRDTATAFGIAGARAAVEIFKHLAQLPTALERGLVRIDSEQLGDTFHPLLPRADCGRCLPGPGYALEGEDDLEKRPLFARLVSPFSGVLHSLDPEDLPQLPVNLWAVRLRTTPDRAAVYAGSSPRRAQLQALLGGVAQALGGGDPGWTAGTSEAEALGLALLDAARRQVLERGEPGTPWPAEAAVSCLDPEGSFWWRSLTLRYGLQPQLWTALEPPGPIPVVTLRTAVTSVTAAGRKLAEALKTAVLHSLGQAQTLEDWPAAAASTPGTHPLILPEPLEDSPSWEDWLEARPGPGVCAGWHPFLRAEGLYVGRAERG